MMGSSQHSQNLLLLDTQLVHSALTPPDCNNDGVIERDTKKEKEDHNYPARLFLWAELTLLSAWFCYNIAYGKKDSIVLNILQE